MHFVFPLCILGQLADFLSSHCLNVFQFFYFIVEKSDIVSKPYVCKVFSIDIDSFRDICLYKDFFHNRRKQFGW